MRYEDENDAVKWVWFFDCANRLPKDLRSVFALRLLQVQIDPTQITGTFSIATPPADPAPVQGISQDEIDPAQVTETPLTTEDPAHVEYSS